MSHAYLPKIFMSAHHDLHDPTHNSPSVVKLLLFYVIPMSLLPPLMYVYAEVKHPGVILPILEPGLTIHEAILVGAAFFMVELLAVALMAMFIQQMGDQVGTHPTYADAYSLAAFAPTPLWLATIGLALPNLWVNVVFMVIAWVFSVGLIRRGVSSLFLPYDDSHTHQLANTLTFMGVMTWCGLLLFLVILLSMMMGWR